MMTWPGTFTGLKDRFKAHRELFIAKVTSPSTDTGRTLALMSPCKLALACHMVEAPPPAVYPWEAGGSNVVRACHGPPGVGMAAQMYMWQHGEKA
jgi:hypothetical protein